MTMTHPGLSLAWALSALMAMLLIATILMRQQKAVAGISDTISLLSIPLLGTVVRWLNAGPWPLLVLRMLVVLVFLLVVYAGLFGNPIPERNIATVLTWTLWWSGVVISAFFLGSAWCAVCPWDSLASWLVRRRWWRRGSEYSSLNLRPPRWLMNVWPATMMFIGLTWLELGAGVTTDPAATAWLALLMVALATVSLAIFERKAFCRNACPVGRTLGFYAQLAPVELRPVNKETCDACETLDCYHGNEEMPPCPTNLVMGRLTQNTFCTSCGTCVQSCPHNNIAWRLRSMAREAITSARPHWDESWFMLILLALTSFHGVTMLPAWEQWVIQLGGWLGDSGKMLLTFTVLLAIFIIIVCLFYLIVINITQRLQQQKASFTSLSFCLLPLAFAYHLAHNLGHLVRESDGTGFIFNNPLGTGMDPLSMAEKHARHIQIIIPQDLLFALQAGLIVFGFWLALRILKQRSDNSRHGLPMLAFIFLVSGFNLWLLTQPMIMRM